MPRSHVTDQRPVGMLAVYTHQRRLEGGESRGSAVTVTVEHSVVDGGENTSWRQRL